MAQIPAARLRQNAKIPSSLKLICPVQSLFKKDSVSRPTQIKSILVAVPPPHEGRFAIVTDVERGMRWTRRHGDERGLLADGEVVWFWRSDAGAKVAMMLSHHAGDGGNQAWSPGRSRISR
jgi:hypothetical protein